ncbi:MAG: hypothetical protein RIS54_1404 [Verrucomicrobiota bacterium]
MVPPMIFAVIVLVLAAGYRVVAAWDPNLVNFSPLMALAFCGGVYFRNRWLWLVPLAALSLSDLYLDHYYAVQFGYEWTLGGVIVRSACFAAAIGLGCLVAKHKTWLNLFSGALGGSLLFYLVTNTASWAGDVTYASTLAGWWQAMTVGHPEFPPTLYFFRNSLVSDLVFTGLFAGAMELAAARAAKPSLPKAA